MADGRTGADDGRSTEESPPAVGSVGRPVGLRRVARGGLLNLLGAAVSSVTGFVLVVVITRSVPKAEAGLFFSLTSVFLLTEIVACLGTGTGLVYFIARARSLGQTDRISSFLRVSIVPVIVVSAATAILLVSGAGLVARWVGGTAEQLRLPVTLLALFLPVAALSDTALAATRGYGTMRPTVTVERIGRTVVQLGLVAAAAALGSVALLSAAWAIPWVASVICAVAWLRHLGRTRPTAPSASSRPAPPWREFWGFTWARGVSSVAQLVLQRLDIVLIAAILGPAQAAIYTAATRFLIVGQLTGASIGNAAQPRLAELFAVHDHRSARVVYQSSTGWIVLLAWPLYLLCAVYSDVFLRIFGHGYSEGRPVVLVLSGAMLVATGCGMVDQLLNMAGRTTWTLANSVSAVAVMLAVDLSLIPRMGILGAAIGWAAALVTNNVVPLVQLLLSLRLHPFGRSTLLSAALAALCFGAIPAGTRLLLPGNVVAAAGGVVVGAALYVVACLYWRRGLELPGLAALRPGKRDVRLSAASTTTG